MTKKLNSNGIKSKDQEWYGLDALKIVYPAVSSCVTVTCVVKNALAGLHLASMPFVEITNQDIADYGKIAKGATAMYVVGMLSRRWTTKSLHNQSGLIYGSTDGGTLIARLREATGFAGVVLVSDTSELGSELEITASLTSNVVTFTYVVNSDSLPQKLTTFEQVGGNVMFEPHKKSGGCVIL
jgi:hypothetical protein